MQAVQFATHCPQRWTFARSGRQVASTGSVHEEDANDVPFTRGGSVAAGRQPRHGRSSPGASFSAISAWRARRFLPATRPASTGTSTTASPGSTSLPSTKPSLISTTGCSGCIKPPAGGAKAPQSLPPATRTASPGPRPRGQGHPATKKAGSGGARRKLSRRDAMRCQRPADKAGPRSPRKSS